MKSLFSFSLYFTVLRAMKEDSEKVPSLLTDYILKGEFFKIFFKLFILYWGNKVSFRIVSVQ